MRLEVELAGFVRGDGGGGSCGHGVRGGIVVIVLVEGVCVVVVVVCMGILVDVVVMLTVVVMVVVMVLDMVMLVVLVVVVGWGMGDQRCDPLTCEADPWAGRGRRVDQWPCLPALPVITLL